MTMLSTARGAAICLLALMLAACVRTPEQKRAQAVEAGKKYLAQQDYGRALVSFKNAIQAVPSHSEAYYQMSLAYAGVGDWKRVVASLQRAVEIDPGHAEAQLKLSQLMVVSGQREYVAEAQQRLQSLLARSGQAEQALTTMAFAEWKLDQHKEAEHHLEEAVKRFPQSLQAAVALARLRLEQKDAAGAERVITQFAERTPNSAAAFTAAGEFYLMRDRWAEAADQFRRALRLDAGNGAAVLGLAAVERRAGREQKAAELYQSLSHHSVKEYRSLYAVYLLQTHQTDKALAEFQRLLQQDPGDTSARTGLVAALQLTQRPDDADKVLAAALQKNAKDADALQQRAALQLDQRQWAAARKSLEQALRLRPDSAQNHFLLAIWHESQSDFLHKRRELTEAVRLDPTHLSARVALAADWLRSNNPKAALDVLDEAPASQLQDAALITQRNWVQLALGQREQVRATVEKTARENHPVDVMLQQAVLALEAKRYADARTVLRGVLAQSPDEARALELLVRSYLADNQTAVGLRELREYAAQRPRSAPIQALTGNLLLSQGDRAGARTALQAARALDSSLMTADLTLAQIEIAERQNGAARQILEELLAKRPNQPTALLWLGHLKMMEGAHAEAIEQYRRVLDAESDNRSALNNMAYLLAESAGKPDEALAYAEKAKELSPEDPAVEDTLGWVYYRKNLFSLAVRHLEAANRVPTARRKYHLAMAYWQNGDGQRSRETLAVARRMNPDLPEARTAAALLGSSGQP